MPSERVECKVEETELEGDHGSVDGIEVTCSKCDHCVEVFGTGEASRRRAGVMFREDCPLGEENFYVVEDD